MDIIFLTLIYVSKFLFADYEIDQIKLTFQSSIVSRVLNWANVSTKLTNEFPMWSAHTTNGKITSSAFGTFIS